MALNFDPTKKVKPPTSSVKIFEEPKSEVSQNIETRNKELTEALASPSSGLDVEPSSLNKPVIKDEQSLNKTLIKPVTENTNGNIETRNTRNKELTGNFKTRNLEVIKDKQSTNKTLTKSLDVGLNKASTFQREILFAIFTEIQSNPFEKETRALNISQLGELINIKEKQALESLRIVILRLEKVGFLVKTKVKTGRSGWTKYGLPNSIFDELLKEYGNRKPVIKDEQSLNKTLIKPVTESPYSNSNLNKDTNNKEAEVPEFQIPENLRSLGIAQKSLQALVRDNFLNFEEIQESLNSFSFDISKNVTKNKTAGFFFGILRNKTPYISSQYAQDQERAIKEQVAKYQAIQNQRVQLAELKLREEFEAYKLKNPNFLEEIKSGNQFLKSSSPKILDEIAFGKYKELINTPSQNEPT